MAESIHTPSRPLRADAANSIARILQAAEHVFAADPTASLDVVARAAGVARTTVHRRFSSREVLLDALVDMVNAKLREALAGANVDTSPPLVALYQLTVATLDLKVDWRASWQFVDLGSEGGRGIDADNLAALDDLLERSLDVGLLRRGVDIRWARSVYMALIHEAATARPEAESAAEWAHLIMQTLLGGIGSAGHDLDALLARSSEQQ